MVVLLGIATATTSADPAGLPDRAGAARVSVPGAGVTLGGYLYLPTQHSRAVPAVLLLHAAGGSALTLDESARLLAERGYAALALSLRGAAGSDGSPGCGVSEAADAVEALRWLARQSGIDPSRLGVLGFGEGGQAALLAAARMQTLKAVVAIAPITEPEGLKYATVSPVLRKRLAQECGSADAAGISPMAQAAEISAPVLLIHGLADRQVPPSQSEMLYNRLQALNKTAELRLMPDAGSELATDEADGQAWYWVATFLGRHQLRAAATRTADQQERVNRFTERGWNLPLSRDLKSIRVVGKVKKQAVSMTQNPHVSGRMDEVRDLWFDGLYMQVLVPGRKKDFLLQELEISNSRYKVLYGLRIGAQRHAVEDLLGPADVLGSDYLEYMNALGVGTARFYVKDDRIAKIDWEYRSD
jgi:dienelactone hydrolase